jgi:hypothetical protein
MFPLGMLLIVTFIARSAKLTVQFQPLLRLLDPTAGRQSLMRNCTWLMSNLVLDFSTRFYLLHPVHNVIVFAVPVQACSPHRSTAATAPDNQHAAILHRRGRRSEHMLGIEVCPKC